MTTVPQVAASVEGRVARVVAEVLRVPADLVSSGLSFPELGMDSLTAVELTAAIEDVMQVDLSLNVVHEHPTVDALCAFLEGRAQEISPNASDARMLADAKLACDISLDVGPAVRRRVGTAGRVLVTGATGFLGAFLVRELADDSTAEIHCLVRPSTKDARTRLRDRMQSFGLWSADLDHRVHIVAGDLSLPRLGMGQGAFAALADSVDAIYHAAADVNWVSSYGALRDTNVLGTGELIRLAFAGAPKPLHFVSSVSVCHSTVAPRTVDENLDALDTIEGLWLGYAQSKCVAEALVRQAGARGLPVTIHRPSLVSGDAVSGRSNPDDLVSRFIAGCIAMRAAPDLDWRVDCVPVDQVAKSIVRLSCAHVAGVGISHITAAAPRHWRECVLWMRLSGYDIELVPYREWLELLAEDGDGNPLNSMRSFFSRTIPAEDGFTLPELLEESRRAQVSDVKTRDALASLGQESRPLSTRVLSRYFDDFERVGLIPTSPARSTGESSDPERQSLDSVRDQIECNLSRDLQHAVRVQEITLTSIHSAESIVAELTASRSGTQSGLFHADVSLDGGRSTGESRRLFVKAKPLDSEVIEVAETVAALASSALGETVPRFRDHLGFTKGHEREVALYADTDARLRGQTPGRYAATSDSSARRWLIVLESIDGPNFEAVSTQHPSPEEYLDAVIRGIARLHAVGIDRRAEFQSAGWQAPVRTHAQRTAMMPLWAALASHAFERSVAWGDPAVRAAHEQAIATLPEWSSVLESGPTTLIHNDFNPRNFTLRRTASGFELCAYDWELATMGLPQRDLVECLAFMLPECASRDMIASRVEQHRALLEQESGIRIAREEWDYGVRAALCDFLVDRLAFYAMVDRIRPQAFLPRVVRGCVNLTRLYPLV